MPRGLLLGLDLGGGGVRCLALDPGSRRVSTAFEPFAPEPVPGVPMGVEYAPAATWAALCRVARRALARAGAGPDDVVGLAATSMRHGSALLDAAGEELLLAPNRDARGTGVAIRLAAESGEALHRLTGHWPNAVLPGARLAALASEEPERFERAATHLSLGDWIAFRLCGERAAEPTQAGETLLFGLDPPGWSDDQAERLGVPRSLLPEPRAPGSPLGALTPVAAEALGLRAGTPVAVGAADTQCGLLGAGVLAPGALAFVVGTSSPVLEVCAAPTLDGEGRLWTVHHLLPGRFALESNAGGVGEALSWIAGLLHPGADHPVLAFLAEAATAPPGCAGLLSGFGAEVMDARRLTLPVGNLTLNYLTSAGDPARRRHLSRAVLEGMAFALRANAEQIAAVTGTRPDTVRVTGGLSRSPFFTQLLADVLQHPVDVTETSEASALGAALCAGVGAGSFASLEEAAAAGVARARLHEPEPEASACYAGLYPGWCQVRAASADAEAQASGFAIAALVSAAPVAARPGSRFRPRILVTAELDAESLEALGAIGDVTVQSYRQALRLLSGASLADALADVHVLVTEVDVVDAAALLGAPDLRVVGVCRGDAVNVDLEACSALGIPVFHTPGRNADAVADLTLAFLLALARRLREADAFLREPGGEAGDMGRMGRAFGTLRGRELWRKTVGLVGLGDVGRGVARRLRPFGARCLVFDPHLPADAVRLAGGEPVDLAELLAESDFVSLHAPANEATRGLLGREELARMKPGAFLVNTARAALVDEEALVEALRSGRLGGAALDVFRVEPPAADHPLLQLENVIATPHVAGNTEEIAAHQGALVVEELSRLRDGRPLRFALDPAVAADFDWSRPRPLPDAETAGRLGRGARPAVTDQEKERAAEAPRPPPGRDAGPRGAALEGTQQMFEAILASFVARAAADAGLGAFAERGEEVTLHFRLTDLDAGFHLGFRDGRVVAALGPPEEGGCVELKMAADLLDGMFTGRRNAMQAAMDGELSFSGDTARAMTLSQIQRDLARLWGAAREEVGDPGDLTALGAKAASGAPAAAAGAGADDVRPELCRVVGELYAAQLITATGGNVSVRVPGADEEAWITPSQLFKGDLRPEILVRIGMDGRALDAGARSPSSEALMHTAVLKARPEARAVIHCHAPNATVLVNADLPFLPISTEAAFFRDIGRIPFVMPGTQELADRIVAAMGSGWAVLMQNHGLLVAGRSLRRAADMAEIIERTSQVIVGCYAVGREPPVLPPETVETLAKYGDLMA